MSIYPTVGYPPLVDTTSSHSKAASPSRKALRDGIEEFRVRARRRWRSPLAYRALYFFQGTERLIVTTSYVKPMPTDALDRAAELRSRYLIEILNADDRSIQ